MVRNDELVELSTTTHEISDVIRELTEKQGYTQTAIAAKLKKAQSYVSLRLKGLKAWNIEELQQLALLLQYNDIFDLFDYIKDYIQHSQSSAINALYSADDFKQLDASIEEAKQAYTAAASYDPNKEIERETPQD